VLSRTFWTCLDPELNTLEAVDCEIVSLCSRATPDTRDWAGGLQDQTSVLIVEENPIDSSPQLLCHGARVEPDSQLAIWRLVDWGQFNI